jgi:hypothetical protein
MNQWLALAKDEEEVVQPNVQGISIFENLTVFRFRFPFYRWNYCGKIYFSKVRFTGRRQDFLGIRKINLAYFKQRR